MKKCGEGGMRQFGNKCFPIYTFFSAYICQAPRIARAYTVRRTKFAHFSLVSLSPRTRSRPDAERIRQGEGRLSRPPKTALERSYLTEKCSSENRILRPRRKKTPDRIPPPKNIIYTYTSARSSSKSGPHVLKNSAPPLAGYSTYRIHLINGYISLHSCQILSPSETGFIVSEHRLTKITLLTLIATL